MQTVVYGHLVKLVHMFPLRLRLIRQDGEHIFVLYGRLSRESAELYASGPCCPSAAHLIPPLGELLTFSRPNLVNQYQLDDSPLNGRRLQTLNRSIRSRDFRPCRQSRSKVFLFLMSSVELMFVDFRNIKVLVV